MLCSAFLTVFSLPYALLPLPHPTQTALAMSSLFLSLWSGLFQRPLAVLSLISTIKTSPPTTPWSERSCCSLLYTTKLDSELFLIGRKRSSQLLIDDVRPRDQEERKEGNPPTPPPPHTRALFSSQSVVPRETVVTIDKAVSVCKGYSRPCCCSPRTREGWSEEGTRAAAEDEGCPTRGKARN